MDLILRGKKKKNTALSLIDAQEIPVVMVVGCTLNDISPEKQKGQNECVL